MRSTVSITQALECLASCTSGEKLAAASPAFSKPCLRLGCLQYRRFPTSRCRQSLFLWARIHTLAIQRRNLGCWLQLHFCRLVPYHQAPACTDLGTVSIMRKQNQCECVSTGEAGVGFYEQGLWSPGTSGEGVQGFYTFPCASYLPDVDAPESILSKPSHLINMPATMFEESEALPSWQQPAPLHRVLAACASQHHLSRP